MYAQQLITLIMFSQEAILCDVLPSDVKAGMCPATQLLVKAPLSSEH